MRTTRRYALLGIFLGCLAFPERARGQDIAPNIQPAPLIRLTGRLEPGQPSATPAFPLLRVWVGGQAYLFRVSQVDPVIPAYRGEEHLREVSPLGLRLLGDDATLARLRVAGSKGQSVTVEGWLLEKRGVLRVRGVQRADVSPP